MVSDSEVGPAMNWVRAAQQVRAEQGFRFEIAEVIFAWPFWSVILLLKSHSWSLAVRSKRMSRRHSGYSQARGARHALRRSSGTEPNRSLARHFLRSQKHRRSRPFRRYQTHCRSLE